MMPKVNAYECIFIIVLNPMIYLEAHIVTKFLELHKDKLLFFTSSQSYSFAVIQKHCPARVLRLKTSKQIKLKREVTWSQSIKVSMSS